MAKKGGQIAVLAVDARLDRQQAAGDFRDRLFEGGAQILDQRRFGDRPQIAIEHAGDRGRHPAQGRQLGDLAADIDRGRPIGFRA